MQKKPKVSLRPVVEAIADLLKELDNLEDAKDGKGQQRAKALRAQLEGASMMLRAECWSGDANEAVYEFPA
jgi:hypothetical protein